MRGRCTRLALLLAVVIGGAAAGCSIPEETYNPSPDSGIDAPADHHLELDPADLTVGEGMTATVTIRATPTPELDTTVTLTAGAGLALGAPSVTLGPGQPSVTVDVTALDDDDAQDGSITITANAPGHDAASARVTVDDDEVLEIVVDADELNFRENSLDHLAVSLSARPPGDVNVAITVGDPGVATASDGLLTFGVDDWDQPQSIDVIGVYDEDTIHETTSVNLTSPPLPARAVTLHVQDIDVQGVLSEQASLDVHEGQPAGTNFRLYLAKQPAGDVVVDIAPQDPRLHVSETSVTFGPGNFNMPHAITVTADGDDNVAGFASSVRMTSPGLPDLVVGVTALDDDHQEILVAAASPFRVTEQGTATFTARLRFQPDTDTIVGVAPLDNAVATAMPGALTFTTAAGATAWNQPQTVLVGGLADDDTTPETTKIRLQAPSVPTYDLDTTIVDDDTLELVVVGAPAQVQEGSAASFTVALAFQPPAPIAVSVTSSDPASIAAMPPTLNFGLGDWSTPQTVMLSAPTDADLVSEQVNITLASPGNLPARILSVGVAEQTTLGITTTAAAVTVAEGVGSATVGVSLSTAPLGPVTLTVSSSSTQVSATAADLTFGPGDWMTPKPVIISALVDDDVVAGSATVTVRGPQLTDRTIAVTTTDSDVVEIRPSTGAVAVTEGQNATFTVRLGHKPPAGVTVNVASLAGAVATVMPPSIDFTPQNWNLPVLVTVNGTGDNDLAAATTTVRLTAAGLVTADVMVNVTDDDVQALVLASAPATMVEGGAQAMFTVKLAFQPAADVTVNLSSNNLAAVTVGPASMTFTPATWSMAKSATLTAPIDDDLVAGAATITVAAPGNAPTQTFDIVVTDPDVLAIVPSTGNVAITEGAAGATVSVQLNKRPAGQVVVSASSNLPLLAGVGPASRTFDAATWNQGQAFTITAPVDDDTAGGVATITLSAPAVPQSVAVTATVTDNDRVEIVPSTGAVAVTEGQNATFTVRLGHKPPAGVTVNVASLAGAVATVMPPSIDFTPQNWNLPVLVTVNGTGDNDLAAAATTVRLTAAGLVTADVMVNVTDDDVQALVLASAPATMIEGGAQAMFTVKLAFQPAADVTVNLTSNNPAAVTVGPASMTFTPATWSMAKTATLTAPVDDDLIAGAATIAIAAPANAPTQTFDVAVTDPDVLTIVNLTGNVAITEGAAGTPVTVRLNKKPAGQVVVSASSNLPLLASVGPASRTFDAATWNQGQAFTITAPVDDDTAGGVATITLSAPAVPQSVAVTATVTDPDVQAILESAANPLAVVEGTTVGFNVHLKHRPTADVTVNVASLAGAIASVSPGSITFTSGNWNVDRAVMVTGAQDVNMVDATTTVRLTANGVATVDVPVAVDDDDVQVIDVGAGTVMINEGDTAAVTVALRYQPAAATTVTVASSNNGKVTVSGNLTFGPADYNIAQSVMLTAVTDADTAGETATVTLGNFDAPLPTSVQVTVHDITVITDLGWPTFFNSSGSLGPGTAVAYKITVAQAGKVDGFGVITGAAGSEAKMALYADTGGVPGALVASVDSPVALGAGTVMLDATDTPIGAGTYWIALRVNPSASIGSTAAQTGLRCTRSMATFTASWPATFGTASCNTAGLMNVFVRTYRP